MDFEFSLLTNWTVMLPDDLHATVTDQAIANDLPAKT